MNIQSTRGKYRYALVLSLALLPNHAWTQDSENERKAVSALGRIEPVTEVVAISGPPGERVERITVKPGQKIEKGEVLAYLDTHGIRAAAVQRAKARVEATKALRAAERKVDQSQIAEIELDLRKLNELMPIKISAQEARIEGIRSQLAIAAYEAKRLRDKNSNAEELIAARVAQDLRAEELETQLIVATKELSQLRSTRVLEKAQAERRLATAAAGMERNALTHELGTREAEVKLAEAELQRSIVRAPVKGTVLRILTWPGERVGRSAILELADTDQMYVVAEVDETDIRFVRPGQRATVTSPALAEPLTGVVENVGMVVAKNDVLDIDPAARVDARVVEVRIRLDADEAAKALSHLQVRVRIDVQSKKHA